jgi:protein-tyrosine-phosphatase
MALDLGTILTAVELVEKAIALYERIESLPQQMEQLGRRMKHLNRFLLQLQGFVQRAAENAKKPENKNKPATTLLSGQLDELRSLIVEIKNNAKKVYDLFDRYKNGILSRSMDLEFRKPLFARVWFSVFANSVDKAQPIIDEIDQERSLLRDYLVLMAVEKAYEPRRGRELVATTAVATTRPTPSPSPTPPRRNCKILFVDPYNEGRSVVAQALANLLGQLTLQARGDWRIAEAQSAGFFAKDKCDCIGVISGLEYSRKDFKMPWWPGGKKPNRPALDAVFDNTWCDYPFKKDIRQRISARTSCGLRKDTFSYFDLIIVFTLREHDNMVKLKEALRKTSGEVPRGKGRVLQLGTYLAPKKGGGVPEILHQDTMSDLVKTREGWNRKVAEIKTALKGLLRQEMGWRQPDDRPPAAGRTLGPGRV